MHSTQARTDSAARGAFRRLSRLAWLPIATALALTGCTHGTSTPSGTGPSVLGLSLTVEASPDVLNLDGASQSVITVTARDANGAVKANVGLRIEIVTGQGIVDVGRLSSKTAVTGGDGRATVTYTAPALPSAGNSDPGYSVTIQVIPSGTDYTAAVARTVAIRLVPQGIILPVAHAPVPNFTWSPAAPGEAQDVIFDGSSTIASCAPDPAAPNDATKCTPEGGAIVAYQWDFGNGKTGNGAQPHTSFDVAGSYVVKLTVVNDRGLTNAVTKTVTVAAVSKPTATFTFSPSNPNINQGVFFDASGSTASSGRSIVSYSWNWGDGNFGSGVQTSHTWTKAQAYVVTLTVTDSAGATATANQTVTFTNGKKPTARFTFSPTAPAAGQVVNFDATLSTPNDPNRPIVRYDWNFGDGTTLLNSTEPRPQHTYAAGGAYQVTLTVTDNAGGISDAFQSTVTVK